jgi:uncharacterized membrane protein
MKKDQKRNHPGRTGAPKGEHHEGLHLEDLMKPEKPKKSGLLWRLRTAFLTGLVVAAPLGITAYLTWTFISFVDTRVKPFIPPPYNPETYLPFTLPGVGLLFAVLCLTFLGAITANLAGRTVVEFGERLLNRMPLVRSIYSALKQIFETVLNQDQTSFEKVGLLEFPRRGAWSIVFISTDAQGEILHKVGDGEEMFACFMPTVPNPTTGFLMFVPKKDIRVLDMSVEQAAKLAISAGLVVPDFHPDGNPVAVIQGAPLSMGQAEQRVMDAVGGAGPKAD